MSTKIKLLIASFILIAVTAIVFGIYYTYFQFNQKDVKDYVNEEALKFPADQQPAVYKIITDGIQHVLADKYLVKQTLQEAKRNGTPKEMELVHAAIMQAKSFGYLD